MKTRVLISTMDPSQRSGARPRNSKETSQPGVLDGDNRARVQMDLSLLLHLLRCLTIPYRSTPAKHEEAVLKPRAEPENLTPIHGVLVTEMR